MCLLIVWLNPEKTEISLTDDGTPKAYPLHEYALILANNRDERYDRPTLPSQFAKRKTDGEEEEEDILGGWDATPGKEGGTWLGLSLKRLKIGSLVNIPERNPKGTRGRGSLVTDFLESLSSTTEYCDEKGLTGESAREYPGFQLITLEGFKTPKSAVDVESSSNGAAVAETVAHDATSAVPSVVDWRLHYASNQAESFSAHTNQRRDRLDTYDRFVDDVFVFSNSPVHLPLLKVADVESLFRKDVLAATEASIAAEAAAQAANFDLRGYEEYEEYEEYLRGRGVGGGRGGGAAALASAAAAAVIGAPVFGTNEQQVAAEASIESAEPADGDEESSLFGALFRILSCRREYERDRELASRVNQDARKLSAPFNATSVFGTRTQTVLLVKWDGSAVWKEKTMREPIDVDQPVWDERTFRVKF